MITEIKLKNFKCLHLGKKYQFIQKCFTQNNETLLRSFCYANAQDYYFMFVTELTNTHISVSPFIYTNDRIIFQNRRLLYVLQNRELLYVL